MAQGPGKYDHHATSLRLETEAEAVLVAVFRGKDGSGFSVQGTEDFLQHCPMLLRRIADEIEADAKGLRKEH